MDFDALAKEARYVDWCGCPGMTWPQSGDSVDLLTTDEKFKGMEVLAETTRDLRTPALCLGVQGKDTAEMLVFAKHAEKLAPAAMISRPPDSGKTQDDMRQYWRALAAVTKRPVILQTTGGVAYRGPVPSVELLIELAKEFPNFGYVKEEAGSVTGDPRLDPERSWQIDVGLNFESRRLRAGISGFHAWVRDYITFENLRVVNAPPFGQVEQVNLQYVNTDFATLAGFELYGECDVTDSITAFATMNYVEGRDHTRNGDAATLRATPGVPSVKVPGLSRGFFSGVSGGEQEPSPGIVPLESRLGIRLHAPSPESSWSVELASRIVDNQDRVASSLLETSTAGFTVWDLRGYWHATETLLLIAGVENFTDKNYREHLDFRSQNGISVFQLGVNFYFGSELTY